MVDKLLVGTGVGMLLTMGVLSAKWFADLKSQDTATISRQTAEPKPRLQPTVIGLSPTMTSSIALQDSLIVTPPSEAVLKKIAPIVTPNPLKIVGPTSLPQTNNQPPTPISTPKPSTHPTPVSIFLPTPTQVVSPTQALAPSPVIHEHPIIKVTTQGLVEKNKDHYSFNQFGGSSLSDNLITLELPSSIMERPWLNLRLQIQSDETLAGFDDPCFMVLQNGVPLFAIGHTAYSRHSNNGWLDVSLRLVTALLLPRYNSESATTNQLTIMAGENGDELGHTSIQIELNEFTDQPQYHALQVIQPSQYLVQRHDGYIALQPVEHQFTQPFFFTPYQTKLSSDLIEDITLGPIDQLRWLNNLYWFKDDLVGYGYALFDQEELLFERLLLPLELTQQITVLPKPY